jgi:hypothetical protein
MVHQFLIVHQMAVMYLQETVTGLGVPGLGNDVGTGATANNNVALPDSMALQTPFPICNKQLN